MDRKAWYVDADIWGRDAITVVEKIKKGDYVLLSGVLERDHWVSQQDGQERESFKLKKSQFEVLVSSVDRQVLKNAGVKGQLTATQQVAAAPAAQVSESEIPF